MTYMASVFSFLLFLTATIYLFWGIYSINLNPKIKINRVFLFLCISLSIWSFGLGAANSASSIGEVLFWRRFAAIGWTTFYAIMLHFTLLLTSAKRIIKGKIGLVVIYIPALISTYIFAISSKLATSQYNFVKSPLGWTNISLNNNYDLFFKLYYMVFCIAIFFLVWQWKKSFKDDKSIRRINAVLLGLVTSLFLGSLTDMVANNVLSMPIPQMAPLFLLLTTWIIYYSSRYYGLIKRRTIEKDEIIITEDEQKKIFNNLSLAFFLGGVVSFSAEYLPLLQGGRGNMKLAIYKGGFLISVGICIYIAQAIKQELTREFLTVSLLLISIPVVTLYFIETASVTVWALPIIIIISSLVFSKQTLLILATVTAIVTQRIVWILKPQAVVYVDKYSYIGRIGFLVCAGLIGLYINKIYVGKIKENKYQTAFQKMNAELSLDFSAINQENFNKKVNKLLGTIGEFFQVDRTYLFIRNHKENNMLYSNEWCRAGIDSELEILLEMPAEVVSWWFNRFKKDNVIYMEDIKQIKKDAFEKYANSIEINVKSVITIPIMANGKLQGVVGLDSVKEKKHWSRENIKLLKIMVNLVANGLTQVKSAKRIEFMAYYDQLTELPNRFLFEEEVRKAIKKADENAKRIGIIFIDLDNFKVINDTMGHNSGDDLLKDVGMKFLKQVEKTNLVARFGGDEFMILLNDITDSKDVVKIADKVMSIFEESFRIKDQEFVVTASAGISMYPADGQDATALIKNADTAMYEAKSKGKSRYAFCTREMKEKIKNNVTLSNDLHKALENNEFLIYYQPQVDVITGRIRGMEALLRWVHPKRGMISPGVFIPLAEENNLINSIGEWVLKTACAQNKRWQNMGLDHTSIAVNLSGIQFLNPHLADAVEEILEETGLEPKYLELEITESIAIEGANHALETLNKLKAIGVAIAIDDFGTEYSSLSRLKMLPVDRIKIDMQFIRGIETDEKDRAVTNVIINLAKSLGLNVLAEGVETQPQLDFLIEKKCDFVQGYYYYKSMPAEEMEAILKAT